MQSQKQEKQIRVGVQQKCVLEQLRKYGKYKLRNYAMHKIESLRVMYIYVHIYSVYKSVDTTIHKVHTTTNVTV